jgi:Tol biopolymer transport system component
VAQHVEVGSSNAARFSVSEEGTLVFRASAGGGAEQLVWMDRAGKRLGAIGEPGRYESPALSPDGTQLAVAVYSKAGPSDIWIYDLERNLGSRFTFSDKNTIEPAWHPDGSRLAYQEGGDDTRGIFVKPVGGGGAATLLYRSEAESGLCSWSSDGRWLTYVVRGEAPSWDIHALSLGDSVRSVPVTATPFHEYQAAPSPDGSLLAYGSTESGSGEVYVQTFPGPGGKWRISNSGGSEPHWRADGRELYYLDPGRTMVAVTVEPGVPPRFSLPRELFQTGATSRNLVRNRFDVTKDGQRFLILTGSDMAVGPTTVVLDWLGRLEKR